MDDGILQPGGADAEFAPAAFAPHTMRRFLPGDEAAVVDLWRAAGLGNPPNRPDVDLAHIVASDAATLFVLTDGALLDGRASGRIIATIVAAEDGHRGWVYYVAVAGAHQGTGLGARLVRFAETYLASCGVEKVLLLIRNTNIDVQSFYGHLGYVVEPCTCMGRWLIEDPPAAPDMPPTAG